MLSRAPDGNERPRLLLVEDDAPVRRSLQLLLQSRGYEVRAYRSGVGLARDPEALRAQCLVSDLLLPDGDGLGLLHELRAVGWAGSAILISGKVDDGVRSIAEAEGYALVLAKPVTDALLTGSIARLISNAPPPTAPARAPETD
jgi:two-component system response regulator FixJ